MENNLPGGWFSELDIEIYRELLSSLPQNARVCELGSWMGRSICSVADIILEKNIAVCIVDTFEGTIGEEEQHKIAKQIDLREEFIKNITRFGLGANVETYKTTTDEGFVKFNNDGTKFDLVFVDADHSTEAVSKDIRNYFLLLKENCSILAGHDFVWETVRKALENTIEKREWLFSKGNMWWIKEQDIKINQNDYQ